MKVLRDTGSKAGQGINTLPIPEVEALGGFHGMDAYWSWFLAKKLGDVAELRKVRKE